MGEKKDMSKEIIVKEAMKTNLAIVSPDISILESAKIMKKGITGFAIIGMKITLVQVLIIILYSISQREITLSGLVMMT